MADEKEWDPVPGIIEAPVTIRLRKDGATVIMSFVCSDSDHALHITKSFAQALDYGCVHFHTSQFDEQSNEIRQAMEERKHRRMN